MNNFVTSVFGGCGTVVIIVSTFFNSIMCRFIGHVVHRQAANVALSAKEIPESDIDSLAHFEVFTRGRRAVVGFSEKNPKRGQTGDDDSCAWLDPYLTTRKFRGSTYWRLNGTPQI